MTCIDQQTPRVKLSGKFFRLADDKFYVNGFSYGPFANNSAGEPLPERAQVQSDFAQMRDLGANTIRVYFPPPTWLLDEALAQGLFVFIDIPWEKHRCFFEDWNALERARERVRVTARELGNHPAVFALSVVNEIPVDIVRFYGQKRVARFVEELLAIAKKESTNCLVTFVNYPTTEFIEVTGCDFTCFNVYLHDDKTFGCYLDRLQHIAGNKPLVLGEYGIDSQREGDVEQAAMLTRHLMQVFRHGLAGSVIFAFTDDWFTGGQQIDNWFFGVTKADRCDKLSAASLRRIWRKLPHAIHEQCDLPKVSVVVCSYNGSNTLRDCLDSLMRLDYLEYEVVLVDDGSTDATSQIAKEFPQVVYQHQENRGLSEARNVGASLCTGEIIAYTDDDCVVDIHWLRYLVQAMQDQQVVAIGGPNLPPPTDSWVAKCVAASPGGPSHVMLDDLNAEHVPGCNLALVRTELLNLGGFDSQFRQAGDDIDICWRLLDAGKKIGFAPGAMVWHKRRSSVSAYIKQQQGYGRSEAMVHFKHPRRFDALGRSNWKGVIYGDGAVGLPLLPPLIYHGRLGAAPFQTIYRQNQYRISAWFTTIEWHLVALFVVVLGAMFPWLTLVGLLMWSATLGATIRAALSAPLDVGAPWWCRPLIWWLYLIQPIVRGWTQHTHLLRQRKLPIFDGRPVQHESNQNQLKKINATRWDVYWDDYQSRGREHLLSALVDATKKAKWSGDFDDSWSATDVKLVGDRWHEIEIRSATEELGWPRRFTRARCTVTPTFFAFVVAMGSLLWTVTALLTLQIWALALGLASITGWSVCMLISRRRCLMATTDLVACAGLAAGLGSSGRPLPSAHEPTQEIFSIAGNQSESLDDSSTIFAAGQQE